MAIKPDEEFQKVKTNYNFGEDTEPEFLSSFFTSNFLQRVLGYLFGFRESDGRPVKLKTDDSGYLKVSVQGTTHDIYEVHKVNIQANSEFTLQLEDTFSRIEVWNDNGDIDISKSTDGQTFGDYITLPSYSFYLN